MKLKTKYLILWYVRKIALYVFIIPVFFIAFALGFFGDLFLAVINLVYVGGDKFFHLTKLNLKAFSDLIKFHA